MTFSQVTGFLDKFELSVFPAEQGKQRINSGFGAVGCINRIALIDVNKSLLGSIITAYLHDSGAGRRAEELQ